MRRFLHFAAFALLAACGASNFSPPSNLDDACVIVRERPTYLRAMQDTQRKWGVPVALQMAALYQESKFIGNARTPFRYTLGVIPMGRQSSAYGYAQALDATWSDYKRKAGRPGAKRDRIKDATDFMGWYMDQSFQRNGISKTDVRNQYLAYHDGWTGWRRGTYKRKPWLMRIADELVVRANMYQAQLISCGKL